MPGPVSDSYDPEWGSRGCDILRALAGLHGRLSTVLSDRQPIFILELIDAEPYTASPAVLGEKDWLLLRFCVKRARESI